MKPKSLFFAALATLTLCACNNASTGLKGGPAD